MTATPSDEMPDSHSQSPEIDTTELLRSLRRKEGTWVEWGKACQQLQKAGYNSQQIFEETGFEPIQQNQVIVAAQVYDSLVSQEVPAPVREHFQRKGSDVLYELRILTQSERAAAAELALEKGLDLDETREVARAIKDFSRLPSLPEGFTTHPGDAIAYQSWKLARQKSDLQERSRLIARGLKFADSPAARQRVEQLLTDFSVTPAKPAPLLPFYRLESDEEMPRMLPVVGKLPLSVSDLQAVPLVDEIGSFQMVKFTGTGAWVPLPGWQVIRSADDPVAFLGNGEVLPLTSTRPSEEMLIVVDRSQRQWDALSYFIVDRQGQLQIQWFEEEPEQSLLGKVILVMRPKRILDEDLTKDRWQIDE